MSTTKPSGDGLSIFKEWLTSADLLAEKLPGLNHSRRSVFLYLAKVRLSGVEHLYRNAKGVPRVPGKRGLAKGAGTEYHYTCLPPEAIVAYEARYKTLLAAAQPGDRRLAALGKGVLSQAEGGRLRAYIHQQAVAESGLSASGIRERCIGRFGPDVTIIPQGLPALVPMPPLRTFQQFIKSLREQEGLDAR